MPIKRKIPFLREMTSECRSFVGLIMLVLMIGYVHALAYVYVTTHIVPKGIEERFRGTETSATDTSTISQTTANDSTAQASITPADQTPKTVTGELQYEKTLPEMLNMIHTHILTMCFIFALSGAICFMTDTLPGRVKKFAIIEPFIGIIVTFLGLWLMRYVHHSFSWLVSVSGTLMALAFGLQCYAVAKELWVARKVTVHG